MIKWILSKIFRKQTKINNDYQLANTSIDCKDTRDFVFYATGKKLPKIHIIPNAPPIRNQGKIGSCASHAVIAAYEYQFKPHQFIEGSELFHYFTARLDRGNMNDTGMSLREACQAIQRHGFAFERFWPYDVSKFNKQPSWLAYFTTSLYKVDRYEKCKSITGIKESLNNDIPVICGIHVQSKFNKLNKKNFIYDPITKSGGGHAVLIVGYSDYNKRFIIRNSWGKYWGKSGHFEMSYEAVEKLTFDWWRVISDRRK